MYLSRVALDVHKRSTMVALANPQQFHGAVEQAFLGERRRRLWRLDQLGDRLYLLLLSEDIPDLQQIAGQFGTGELPETKEYGPLLKRVQAGTIWRFRLTANPTKSVHDPKNPAKRGRVCAHITTEFQEKWLMEQAEKHAGSQCIYIYDWAWKVQPSFYEARNYESVTFISQDHLELLDEMELEEDGIVLCIMDTCEQEPVLEKLESCYGGALSQETIGQYFF